MYFQSNYTAENSGPTNLNGANGWMISHPGKRPRFIFCCNLQQDGYYKEKRHVLQWTCALFYCAILSSKGYKESFFFYINEHLSKTIEISVKFYLPPFISIYISIWVISRRKFIKVVCWALFKKMLFCYLGKTEGNVLTFMKLFLFLKPLFLARPVQWASHWFLEGEGERLISLPASPPWKHFARATRCSWTQFQ